MYSFKHNQQDATLYNILYYCQCCSCFGRFLRPSSGAQELYTQHLVRASPAAATASVVPDAVCIVLELLMMGEETARNMYSTDNTKEYCVTLRSVGCI
jgi:hypothetical protein